MTSNIKKCRETHLVAPYHSSNVWKKHLLTRHGVCGRWIMDRFCQVFHRPIGIWAWAKCDSKKRLQKKMLVQTFWIRKCMRNEYNNSIHSPFKWLPLPFHDLWLFHVPKDASQCHLKHFGNGEAKTE